MGEVTSWDDGAVRVLALDRPERLNAMTTATAEGLERELRAAEADPGVGAVVLTGMGEHFSAGGDARAILEVNDGPDEVPQRLMRAFHRLVEEVWDSALPVVAAVSGIAYGGGFNLALACDLVVCSVDTRWCQVFVRRGVVPDLGGVYLLPRIVGMQRAKELMLLAPEIDAAGARDLGLVNAVVDSAEAGRALALAWATELAQRPRLAVSLTKQLINSSTDGDLHPFLAKEAMVQASVLRSQPAREAFEGFLRDREGGARPEEDVDD